MGSPTKPVSLKGRDHGVSIVSFEGCLAKCAADLAHTQKNCELVTGNAEFSTAAFRLLLVPREAWRCLSSEQLAIASIQAAN
jgi:hypothetical protein